MKSTLINVSIDFIGGLSPLTQAEEIALSEYFKKKKQKKGLKKNTPTNNGLKQKLEKV